ncbi:MAG: hypothetical protein CBC82_01005 [Cellvibrionales bacterium TMED122]|nr:MAG: hypothetical protein CBC82_01005 [Cellvibrionales bacterium TMED122]
MAKSCGHRISFFSVANAAATGSAAAVAMTNKPKKGPKSRPRFEDGEAEVHLPKPQLKCSALPR